ncbi:hypothetical protein [Nocardia sp. NPDC057440]|uniref:hypothetical protein n=1 Tax=Nocardia sp. NPDC057440 TaxID=3346134 RepID=UPI00366D5334
MGEYDGVDWDNLPKPNFDFENYEPYESKEQVLDSLKDSGQITRQLAAQDREVVAITMASLLEMALLYGGFSSVPFGNVAAIILCDEGGFHRRHQC